MQRDIAAMLPTINMRLALSANQELGRGRRAAADKARKRTLTLAETGQGWGSGVEEEQAAKRRHVSKLPTPVRTLSWRILLAR